MLEPAMVAMRQIWEASPRARPASIARVPRLCGRIWLRCRASGRGRGREAGPNERDRAAVATFLCAAAHGLPAVTPLRVDEDMCLRLASASTAPARPCDERSDSLLLPAAVRSPRDQNI
jgi:hypothetical protein